MRPFRFAVSALAAFGVVVATATTAAAAPPVGCYGVPDYPTAFFCITSFTPQEAVGEPSSVSVPRVCAGECYGPFAVPVPAGAGGSGQVATLTYGGQTYSIVVGQVPPLPAPSGQCPGSNPVLRAETEPYVCFHSSSQYYGEVWYIGTCALGSCTVIEIVPVDLDLSGIVQAVRDFAAETADGAVATVRDAVRCESLNICHD